MCCLGDIGDVIECQGRFVKCDRLHAFMRLSQHVVYLAMLVMIKRKRACKWREVGIRLKTITCHDICSRAVQRGEMSGMMGLDGNTPRRDRSDVLAKLFELISR